MKQFEDGEVLYAEDLNNIVNAMPEIDNTDSDADFAILDENGNTLLEIGNGRIRTLRFDTDTALTTVDDEESDETFIILDEAGNKLATFENGQIKTLRFDSNNAITTSDNDIDDAAEFSIVDDKGKAILECRNGYFKTQRFDAEQLVLDVAELKRNGGVGTPDDEDDEIPSGGNISDLEVGDRIFETEQVLYTTDDKEYIGHIDDNGIHAKNFFIQTSAGTIGMKNILDMIGSSKINVSLPNKIYAVVGDTLLLFYRGIVQAVDPYRFDILVSCSKGKQTPRYFEYTPTTTDVGTTTFKITVKDDNGNICGEASCKLVTVNAPVNPQSPTHILCFGDSLTSSGVWCAEGYRRLALTGGSPAGKGLSNIIFKGSKTNAGAGYFGVGGWQWSDYTTVGRSAVRFYIENATTLRMNAVYTYDNREFTISEINVIDGTGNILCNASSSVAPTGSGVLTKKSGDGDTTIAFTSAISGSLNPLWDYENSKMSFIPYATKYCNNLIDVVYTLLSWNRQSPHKTDFSFEISNITLFANTLHTEFPNAKLKIMGIQIPSVNGGMGANYGASGTGYADGYGNVVTAFNQNAAYQEFANRDEYKDFVEFINVSSQFDTEYNMPYLMKAVNSRNTSSTEMVGTNGVHPATIGYYQIGDILYRSLVADFCLQ